jgi:hypothetical protein
MRWQNGEPQNNYKTVLIMKVGSLGKGLPFFGFNDIFLNIQGSDIRAHEKRLMEC